MLNLSFRRSGQDRLENCDTIWELKAILLLLGL
jgi:hypothetical protein